MKVLKICMLIIISVCATYGTEAAKPNFVIVMTDDQDVTLNGLYPMKKVQKLLADQGATFENAFTTSPVCCPSRSSFLTGLLAHNHHTKNNSKEGGCYSDFWQELEMYTFPAKLQQSGYNTFYAGKYLNQYYSSEVPHGYDQFYGLHGNSQYYNYTLNENGITNFYEDEYLTDILLNRSLTFINDVVNAPETSPFIMIISPPAPHAPFESAEKYKDQFLDVKAPRTPNFNMQHLDKHWLLTMPPSELPPEIIDHIDEIYRSRWRTLLSVDDLVESIVSSLTENELIENTYIFYTSDNGYHLGQFGQAFDKRQPYETDIRVPLIVRGPNIKKKSVVKDLVALIDFAPSILELAEVHEETLDFNGLSFAGTITGENEYNSTRKRNKLLIEYWGEGDLHTYNPDCPWAKTDMLNQCTLDAACHCQDAKNNTYNCIRDLSPHTDYLYCKFKDSQNYVEAYNLQEDQYQLTNIGYTEIPSIRADYELLLTDMVQCKGKNCVV